MITAMISAIVISTMGIIASVAEAVSISTLRVEIVTANTAESAGVSAALPSGGRTTEPDTTKRATTGASSGTDSRSTFSCPTGFSNQS